MSELCINFSYSDNVAHEINQLKGKLESRIDDYRGVRNSIANINSNTDNLYQANTYLDKKRSKLEEKTQKLARFKTAVTGFSSRAEQADKEVANQIKASTKAFCREHGLGYGVFYTLGVWAGEGVKWLKNTAEKIVSGVVSAVKGAVKWIEETYEKHKYLINFIVDAVSVVASVVVLVATVATGNVPMALAAAWSLAKAISSVGYSKTALWAHKNGNDALAEELSGKGMKDDLQLLLGEKAGSLVYHGLNIAAFAATMGGTIKDIKYLHNVDNVASKYGDILTPESIAGIQSSGKRTLIKITTGLDFTSKSPKAVAKTFSNILKAGNGFASKGLMGIFGIGIFKDISGMVKDITSIFNPKLGEALPY